MYLVALLNFSNYFIVKSKYCTPKFKVNEKMIGSYKIKLLTNIPKLFLAGISYQRGPSGKNYKRFSKINIYRYFYKNVLLLYKKIYVV